MLILSLILLIFIVEIAYALNVTNSQPWHTAQQIVNPDGRVFDDEGRACSCDVLMNPSAAQM